ncbi:MAG: endopeptidase La [Treponema sp.]|jgi:ATP-dependent Lon protease|nr:endopeptidase La [Treponema sp.]
MSDQIAPLEQLLPGKLPIVSLVGRPVFPGIFTPLMILNPIDVKVVERAVSEDGLIGLIMLANEVEMPALGDFYKVGTVAKIVKKINLPDGGLNIFVSTFKRFKVKKAVSVKNPVVAAVQYLEDAEDGTPEVKALARALLSEMKQISENNPLFSEEMRLNMMNIDQPGKIADFIASILNIDKMEQQSVLEQINVRKRMEQVLVFIKKEQELFRIQKRITNEINDRLNKSQREYFLREELKAIKTELGMSADAKTSECQRFKEKFEAFHFEGEIKETVEQELEKFTVMEAQSPEYVVTRNYLDMIASLPWGDPAPEQIDLSYARKTLENDHYGLKDVKNRIIEYLAVRKLRNSRLQRNTLQANGAGARDREGKTQSGSIICLVGPPGVGKTSVGKSVSRALNKKFFRFSVGGMRDEAEIKGHRRTYIGAMPGKIIQGIKITKTKDPVFMIDEIDKMAASYHGDPASALLEALDPEQNNSFRDHYLDLPFDISRIFFIVTANTLDTIPPALLDRMEIIELPGYISAEKLEIAKHYLVPKSLEKSGLEKRHVKYGKASLLHIANCYAREAGVRNFEKNLDKIHRKLAREIVETEEGRDRDGEPVEHEEDGGETPKVAISAKDNVKKKSSKTAPSNQASKPAFVVDKTLIEKYLGKPLFPDGEIKKANRPGMSIGLAWTSMGGDTLVIEATSVREKGGFTLTGNMGDTMKESASIALTVAQKIGIERYGVDASWFEQNRIHLHIPAGATPKDGPSAGVTMAVALCSLFCGRVITDKLVMTGELSLTGRVLPIGGLKEKTIAAARNKARYVIIPKENARDLDEIPDIVKKGLEFYPVEFFEEALRLALP